MYYNIEAEREQETFFSFSKKNPEAGQMRSEFMRDEKTSRLVLTALMTCLVLVATMSIRIPSPFTHGYVHLGDSMIFLSVLLLGKKGGAAASGLGSCLADLCGGYGMYAPWTLLIKAVMAFIMGAFIERMIKRCLLYTSQASDVSGLTFRISIGTP